MDDKKMEVLEYINQARYFVGAERYENGLCLKKEGRHQFPRLKNALQRCAFIKYYDCLNACFLISTELHM